VDFIVVILDLHLGAGGLADSAELPHGVGTTVGERTQPSSSLSFTHPKVPSATAPLPPHHSPHCPVAAIV
jgi:hypothetical protein